MPEAFGVCKLLSIISWYVPKWMPISNILLKTPLIGKFLAQIIPICNYSLLHPSLNKKQLIDFSNEIFKIMEIEDDKDHYIKVRDNIRYNYLLNTTNKSKTEIFKELQ